MKIDTKLEIDSSTVVLIEKLCHIANIKKNYSNRRNVEDIEYLNDLQKLFNAGLEILKEKKLK